MYCTLPHRRYSTHEIVNMEANGFLYALHRQVSHLDKPCRYDSLGGLNNLKFNQALNRSHKTLRIAYIRFKYRKKNLVTWDELIHESDVATLI